MPPTASGPRRSSTPTELHDACFLSSAYQPARSNPVTDGAVLQQAEQGLPERDAPREAERRIALAECFDVGRYRDEQQGARRPARDRTAVRRDRQREPGALARSCRSRVGAALGFAAARVWAVSPASSQLTSSRSVAEAPLMLSFMGP